MQQMSCVSSPPNWRPSLNPIPLNQKEAPSRRFFYCACNHEERGLTAPFLCKSPIPPVQSSRTDCSPSPAMSSGGGPYGFLQSNQRRPSSRLQRRGVCPGPTCLQILPCLHQTGQAGFVLRSGLPMERSCGALYLLPPSDALSLSSFCFHCCCCLCSSSGGFNWLHACLVLWCGGRFSWPHCCRWQSLQCSWTHCRPSLVAVWNSFARGKSCQWPKRASAYLRQRTVHSWSRHRLELWCIFENRQPFGGSGEGLLFHCLKLRIER